MVLSFAACAAFLLLHVGLCRLCACRLLVTEYDFQKSPMRVCSLRGGNFQVHLAHFLGRGSQIGNRLLVHRHSLLLRLFFSRMSFHSLLRRSKMVSRFARSATHWPNQISAARRIFASINAQRFFEHETRENGPHKESLSHFHIFSMPLVLYLSLFCLSLSVSSLCLSLSSPPSPLLSFPLLLFLPSHLLFLHLLALFFFE